MKEILNGVTNRITQCNKGKIGRYVVYSGKFRYEIIDAWLAIKIAGSRFDFLFLTIYSVSNDGYFELESDAHLMTLMPIWLVSTI